MKESRAQRGDNVNVFALLLSKEGDEGEEKKRAVHTATQTKSAVRAVILILCSCEIQ